MCGGTQANDARSRVLNGLSPRVRGNPQRCCGWPSTAGSIPACAGEPPAGETPRGGTWVYPRVCGGTDGDSPAGRAEVGLSPRVRGNPPGVHQADGCPGSIPACAGEPASLDSTPTAREVYPRVCGGTSWRIDTLYFISFASGTGLTVSYQVHAVSVYNFLGRFSQTSDALLSRRRRISPSHHD